MGSTFTRLGVGCAGVLAGLALASAPALASSAAGLMDPAAPAAASSARPAIAPAVTESPYFAGYGVDPAEGISSDGTTFRLPKVSCSDPSSAFYDILFGELVNNSTGSFYVDGGATDAGAAGIASCAMGVPGYAVGAITASGGEQDQTTGVNPGDVIQTRVEETPTGEAIATATDLTTGVQATSEGDTNGEASEIQEGAIPVLPFETDNGNFVIPKFKQVKFSRSQVGSVPLSQVDPTGTELDQDGPVQIVPSAIPAKHPGAFTLTEKSDQ